MRIVKGFVLVMNIFVHSIVFSQTFPNPSTLSTGQGALGTLDPIWTVSQWYTNFPPNPIGLVYNQALISNNCAPGSWVDPASLPPPVNNGNWVTGNDPNCAGNTNAGYRYFRLTLNLPPDCNGNSIGEIGNYVLNFSGYVDNAIADVFLNGTALGISGGNFNAGGQLNFSIAGPWLPGINNIDVLIYNTPNGGAANPYGLLLVANSSVNQTIDTDGDGFSDLVDLCPCLIGSSPDGCPPPITSDVSICEGESTIISVTGGVTYVWSNGSQNASIEVSPSISSTYTVNVQNTGGTSISLQSTVTVLPVDTTYIQAVICEGSDYYLSNNTFELPGTYTITEISSNGCDSVLILELDVLPTFFSEIAVSACENYTWNGQTYTNSGQYTYQTINSAGCDSIVQLNLTINSSSSSMTNVSTCDSYTWNGQTYTNSGQYSYQTTNSFGCDSLALLELNILNSTQSTQFVTACEVFNWSASGISYSSSGQYTSTIVNAAGCDSVLTLNLTINNPTENIDTHFACESYTWIDGLTYTSTTSVPTFILTNASGCDSIVTLDLTITAPSGSFNSISSCDSYTWNGQTYTNSGQYSYETLNAAGCDSIAVLDLTINSNNSSLTNISTCDSFIWNGQMYTNSGQYSYQTTNSFGCDSIVFLNLELSQSITTSETIWVCDIGDIGTSVQSYQNAGGCDSTHTIYYTLLPDTERAQAVFSTQPNQTVLLPSGELQVVNNSIQSSDFLWNFGETPIWINELAPSYTYTSPGQYTIMLIADNSYNCPDTAIRQILIEEDMLVFVPNSFTPDGDEFNNIFLPLISGNFDPYAYTLLIFNRWGQIVFESRNSEIGWDGTFGGVYAPDGVYTWLIKLKTKSTDRISEYTGHVVLMR